MNNAAPKSAMTAGALGILLGAFGMHDWYLGKEKSAKRHVALLITGVVFFVLSMIARALIPVIAQLAWGNTLNSIATTLRILGWITLAVDVVWGAIEGILLLVQGDAGLVAQGIAVKTPESVNPTPTSNPAQSGTQISSTPVNPAKNSLNPAQSGAAPANPTNSASPASDAAAQSAASPRPRVELPPTPTLAEQGSNVPQAPQPIVFHSSNIASSVQPQALSQPVGTKNVPMTPLTVAGKNGKATINPSVLRKFLIAAVLIIAVVVGGILLKNGISSVLSAGYQQTYHVAKELSPRIKTAHDSKSCQYVVDFVEAAMIDRIAYGDYVNTCRDLVVGVKALVDQLGDTTAMSWNAEMQTQYKAFVELYNDAFPEDNGLAEQLQLYQTWHAFLVLADRLTVDSSESEFQEAADLLRTSNNLALSKYSQEWLDRQLAYLQKYHEYWDTSYTDENKEALRLELETQRAELDDWVRDHRPNITELVRIFVPDTALMYDSFTTLYDTIKTAYEQHYDKKSGDCNTAGNKVYCS